MFNFGVTKTARTILNATHEVVQEGSKTAVAGCRTTTQIVKAGEQLAKGAVAALANSEAIGNNIATRALNNSNAYTEYHTKVLKAKSDVVSHYNKLRAAKRQAHRFFITNQDKTQEVLTQSQIVTILPLLTTFELNREELQELLTPATVGQLFNAINNIAITTRSLLSLFKDMDTVYEEMDQEMLQYPQDIIDELYATIAQITTLESDVELDDTK